MDESKEARPASAGRMLQQAQKAQGDE